MMDFAATLHDPIFIAKFIDFVVFAVAIVYLYRTQLEPMLVDYQESQNKAVADAAARRAACEQAVETATAAISQAELDATHMVEIGRAQAAKLIADERTAAQAHAQRIAAHAAGELERERYRVRRELLEDTVERATASARAIVTRDLTPARQQALVEGAVADLEAGRA
jgi:F-type H+-transporting ATPase subunit b